MKALKAKRLKKEKKQNIYKSAAMVTGAYRRRRRHLPHNRGGNGLQRGGFKGIKRRKARLSHLQNFLSTQK